MVMSLKRREKLRARKHTRELYVAKREFCRLVQHRAVNIIKSDTKLPSYFDIEDTHFPNYSFKEALEVFTNKRMTKFIKKLRRKGYNLYTKPEKYRYTLYLRVYVEEYQR